MQFSKRQILIAGGAVALVVIVFFLVSWNLRSSSTPPQVKLLVWGMSDEGQDIQKIFENYRLARPNVEIRYERIAPEGYDEAVVNALAAGRGPDVFMIHNRALPKEQERLAPAPAQAIGLLRFRELFPQVAEQDFVSGGQIYALPLYLDTLALLYHKDLFDSAGIVSPPLTWNDFQAAVQNLRVVGQGGQVVRAAAAIGATDRTVGVGADLLQLLMIQNGADMTDGARTRAIFASGDRSGLAIRAFNFYLQFANAASSLYTWNDAQPPARESFAAGNVAMIFGYQKDAAGLKEKSPFLNFGIAPVPQPAGAPRAVSYADYWGFAVSKQSRAASWAWDFVAGVAANPQNAKLYGVATGRPPALRALIGEYLNDPALGVFAKQALTARSWYQADENKIRTIFNDAIRAVLSGELDSVDALEQAEGRVNQLMARNQ